ncbi:MAG TPA: glycine betaine ABC transporter substrate-binding protein [Thermoanaerobaculia bacterium]|jgi:glycine betaine/choline ABC-type transport system substrate-binding protein
MRRQLLVVAAAGLFAAACARRDAAVRIGSKGFTEQVLLGEIAAQALEAKGVRVERRFQLGGSFVCHRAMLSGDLDLYPEYTGTAFTAILGEAPISDPIEVASRVTKAYAEKFDVVWSPPLGFENTFAIVVRGEDATGRSLKTISDLARVAGQMRPGFGPEFLERKDGYPGLAAAYGLKFRDRPIEMDIGLLYPALLSHRVDVVAGNSTDGLIAAMDLAVLEDDKRYFPPYEAAFVVRGPVWRDNAAVREVLVGLAGRIDVRTMRRLNAAVDRDKRPAEDVARAFLSSR